MTKFVLGVIIGAGLTWSWLVASTAAMAAFGISVVSFSIAVFFYFDKDHPFRRKSQSKPTFGEIFTAMADAEIEMRNK